MLINFNNYKSISTSLINMIGIIYKFTIIHGGIKKDGNFPFYVGQHYDISIEKFLSKRIDNYCGSGSIWNKFITILKKSAKE